MTADSQAAGLDADAANEPRILLADHHREIEEACRTLRACARTDSPRDLIEPYRQLERAVLEHMQAEESVILADFAAHDPGGARVIRDEHAAIRESLFRVGVDVELHAARLDELESLIELLHAHAAREDALMYPWAQVHLPLSTRRRLFIEIGRSLQAIAGLRALWAPPRASG